MKRFSITVVLSSYLAFSAWSQTTTFPPPQPALSQVKQFLGLTDSQVTAILQNNQAYNEFSFQQQQAIQHAQSQIAIETAQDPLDPIALGTLYAGIESACRDLRSKAATSQTQNISVLTDAQRAKLNMLNDALKLAPIISEAQSGNLLGSTNSPPFIFSAFSSGSFTSLIGFPSLPGCGVNGVSGGVLGGFLPPPLPSPTQPGVAGLSTTPAPANRAVNKVSGDFGPGSLPQTKTQ
jgi:Spy/CpxP family protein refolding chaperone